MSAGAVQRTRLHDIGSSLTLCDAHWPRKDIDTEHKRIDANRRGISVMKTRNKAKDNVSDSIPSP
jgi:hypothetical protein